MSYTLRDYQQKAINETYNWLKTNKGNPVVVAPTGSGKAILIAEMVRLCVKEWHGRVLVLAHVKELLEQEGEKLSKYLPEIPFTYYSAGIGEKDFDSQVVIAGIQSVYLKAEEAGRFDMVLIDECHLISPNDETMYQRFLSGIKELNPKVRIVGFTATPFRTGSGSIVGDDKIFCATASEIMIRPLIDQGYLSKLIMKGSAVKIDCSKLHIRAGEFVASELEELLDEEKIQNACKDIVERTKERKSILVFTSCVKHAERVCQVLRTLSGERCEIITGETPKDERDSLNREFRANEFKFLVNVNVLTTGFDAPAIDCVVLLRPTASTVLYLQMVGRGLRIAEGKTDCLILDYGQNALRHGPIDGVFSEPKKRGEVKVKAQKECPACHSIISAGFSNCPDCGFEFPKRSRGFNSEEEAGEGALFVGDKSIKEYDVLDFNYREWRKKDWKLGDPVTVRCDYQIGFPDEWVSEWVCPEHEGFARGRFESWWSKRSNYPPPTTASAVLLYSKLDFARPLKVRVIQTGGKKFPEVRVIKLSEIAPANDHNETCMKCKYRLDPEFMGVENKGGVCQLTGGTLEVTQSPCENFELNDFSDDGFSEVSDPVIDDSDIPF